MDILKAFTEEQLKKEVPQFNIGDTVKVMETRPLSKTKRWRVISIVEKAR